MAQSRPHDHVYWYLSEVTSRVVAKSGIPTDRCHIGKIVLQSFKDNPDFVAQIDGGTGESETNDSLLKRSVQCAISFREMGLKRGDVMVLMAPNHLDLAVPFYAAMYLGVVIAPVDRFLKIGELQHTFKTYEPSVIFCQSDKTQEVETALTTQNTNARIITFDRRTDGLCLFDILNAKTEEIDNFKAKDFNAEDSIAMILPTSGSTGLPKGAALTYSTWMITGPHLWTRFIQFPSPTRSWLILSPLQWLSAVMHYIMSPFIKYTRVQTSQTVTLDHTRFLIDTYKPTSTLLSPPMVVRLLKSGDYGQQCGLTCFETILLAGSAVDKKTLELIKTHSPNTTVINVYGMTELSTIAFQGHSPLGSIGKPSGIYQHRLVNIDTQEDIEEPYVNGELWIKGPMFTEYYNNPKATEEAFDNGWFKTGDLFYRDEQSNYFFVERIKMLLKYKLAQISPSEIEGVIRAHPSVVDVAVTGISDPDCGDLPVACVIPKPGCDISAKEIKDLVKEKLSDTKQLRGGVAFVTSFPLTASSKVNRKELKEMVRNMKLE